MMRILTKKEQARFDTLRERKNAGTLTVEETEELNAVFQKLYAAEETYLAPETARMATQNQATRERIAALQALTEREKHLAGKLRATLAELQKEETAINAEWSRLYGASTPMPKGMG